MATHRRKLSGKTLESYSLVQTPLQTSDGEALVWTRLQAYVRDTTMQTPIRARDGGSSLRNSKMEMATFGADSNV